jgi:aminopeptidase N
MENTTVTFMGETLGQANPSFVVMSHELGHQWVGDWVTVRSFDDLWIKEGMATLLSLEADRVRQDLEGKGRLFGYYFNFTPSEAVRDRSLKDHDKYNTGPYGRAAWLLSQIRATIGEPAFWQAVRKVLDDHARGSIDSETFLRAFGLDDAAFARALHAIDEKRGPTITSSAATDASGGARVTFEAADPGATLVAPIGITVVDAAGQATRSSLSSGARLSVVVPSGGYLAVDEEDVHPDWAVFASPLDPAIAPLLLPASDAAQAAFLTRSAAHQERALAGSFGTLLSPAWFSSVYGALDSALARQYATASGCLTWSLTLNDDWGAALLPSLRNPVASAFSSFYASCNSATIANTFGAELAFHVDHIDAVSVERLDYLLSFDYGEASNFAIFSKLALEGPTLQLREEALRRLGLQSDANFGYAQIADTAPWKDFFRSRLDSAKSRQRFVLAWHGALALQDSRAFAVAGRKLSSVGLTEADQLAVACDVFMVSSADGAAWRDFQGAAQPWSSLPANVQKYLAKPGSCATTNFRAFRSRPRRTPSPPPLAADSLD